jgi:hypothetical protein
MDVVAVKDEPVLEKPCRFLAGRLVLVLEFRADQHAAATLSVNGKHERDTDLRGMTS